MSLSSGHSARVGDAESKVRELKGPWWRFWQRRGRRVFYTGMPARTPMLVARMQSYDLEIHQTSGDKFELVFTDWDAERTEDLTFDDLAEAQRVAAQLTGLPSIDWLPPSPGPD